MENQQPLNQNPKPDFYKGKSIMYSAMATYMLVLFLILYYFAFTWVEDNYELPYEKYKGFAMCIAAVLSIRLMFFLARKSGFQPLFTVGDESRAKDAGFMFFVMGATSHPAMIALIAFLMLNYNMLIMILKILRLDFLIKTFR